MKTVLVIAGVLGLSSTAALAECAGHVTASAKVDKEVTTASIAAPKMDPREEAAVLKQSEGQAKVTE
jgi:hypothetical protein